MEIEPIGTLHTCFGGKFGVPRQPGLAPSAWGILEFHEAYRATGMLKGLDGFSHVWLIFGFHQTLDEGWSPTVRPPRLGGNDSVGVFASRSTYRPNGLGLSLVKLDGIEGANLRLSGVDLVNKTPIFDVKPYLPYAEALPDAAAGYASAAIPRLDVRLEKNTEAAFFLLDELSQRIILEVLALDPRPASAPRDPQRTFGASLCGKNVRFYVDGRTCWISEIRALETIA